MNEILLMVDYVYKYKLHSTVWRYKITSKQFYNTFIKAGELLIFSLTNYTILDLRSSHSQ